MVVLRMVVLRLVVRRHGGAGGRNGVAERGGEAGLVLSPRDDEEQLGLQRVGDGGRVGRLRSEQLQRAERAQHRRATLEVRARLEPRGVVLGERDGRVAAERLERARELLLRKRRAPRRLAPSLQSVDLGPRPRRRHGAPPLAPQRQVELLQQLAPPLQQQVEADGGASRLSARVWERRIERGERRLEVQRRATRQPRRARQHIAAAVDLELRRQRSRSAG
eukprot:5168401-Pleurochrysis_carterae.AAC.1